MLSIHRVCRIEIENFRGVTSSKIDVPPNGLRFKGDEGTGKTSHLDAFTAAFRGTDLGVEVIRRGADKTTLLFAFDDGTVIRRSVTAKNGVGQPTVTNGDMKVTKPAAWLAERLGLAAFDVVRFIGSKPEERVRMLQEAVPCSVTIEQLRAYVPQLESFDCSGHGLAVLTRLHKMAYDKRTAANANAKTKREDAKRAAAEAAALVAPDSAPTVDDAIAAKHAADGTLATLRAQLEASRAHAERTSAARARVTALREEAQALTVDAATIEKLEADRLQAEQHTAATAKHVEKLERELIEMRAALADAKRHEAERTVACDTAATRGMRAAQIERQAGELEATLLQAAPPVPSEETCGEAIERAAAAALAVEAAHAAAAARDATAKAERLEADAVAAEANATRLDGIVTALKEKAPREIVKASGGGIEGLEIDGDTIRIDGVALDSLSSGEQLRLSVRLAKRLNKAPLMIIDHLEHLAPKRRDDFLREACADGWQVFTSETTDDDKLVIEGIVFDEAPETEQTTTA